MKRILVTGNAGLIGTELCDRLEMLGYTPRGLDLAPRRPGALPEDICDPTAVDTAMEGCDGIIHLAAVSRVAWGEAAPPLCHHVNVTGTRTLIEAALARRNRPWFLFASSREVYGDPRHFPVTEDMDVAPANHYGRSKAEGEALVNSARAAGLATATLRFSNVYGNAFDHPDRAVPSLLWRAMSGEDLTVTGASVFFDFVHVTDCVNAMTRTVRMLETGRTDLPTVHLTTGIATTLAELAALASDVVGRNATIQSLPPRSFDVTGFVGNPERARAVLGWEATVPLREGLMRLRDILAARGAPPDPVGLPISPPRPVRERSPDRPAGL